MKITHLFLKTEKKKEMRSVATFLFSEEGIRRNIPCSPLRQILITSLPVLKELGLAPGELRENLVVDYPDLHELPSGTEIQVGEASIQLTFHCEPCKRVMTKRTLKSLEHRRGVLGRFLNAGCISTGNSLTVANLNHEPIPYDVPERISWYLRKQTSPVTASKLIYDIGLSNSYLRALPALLKRIPNITSELVLFNSHTA